MLFLQSKPGVNETKSKLTVFSGVILSPETKPIKIYTAPQHTAWAWIETRLSGSRFESRSGQTTVLHVLLLAGDESHVGIWWAANICTFAAMSACMVLYRSCKMKKDEMVLKQRICYLLSRPGSLQRKQQCRNSWAWQPQWAPAPFYPPPPP